MANSSDIKGPAIETEAEAGSCKVPTKTGDDKDDLQARISHLETLDTAIDEARRKVENGRVYDTENEKVRIKWIRALAYAVNIRRQVTNDRDLAELAEDIERLKEATGLGDEL